MRYGKLAVLQYTSETRERLLFAARDSPTAPANGKHTIVAAVVGTPIRENMSTMHEYPQEGGSLVWAQDGGARAGADYSKRLRGAERQDAALVLE